MFKLVLNPIKSRWTEILVSGLVCWLSSAAVAQSAPQRSPIDQSQIAAAMGRAMLRAEGEAVSFATPMTASVANATIEVDSVSSIKPHSIRLRLVCSDRSECLPFFATATYPDSVDVAKLVSGRTRPAGARVDADAGHGALQSPSTGASELSHVGQAPVSEGSPILRAGAPATLELDAERIHIRIEVICLQSGAAGNRIRVASRDRKQTYVAEVVAPALLKGEFPK